MLRCGLLVLAQHNSAQLGSARLVLARSFAFYVCEVCKEGIKAPTIRHFKVIAHDATDGLTSTDYFSLFYYFLPSFCTNSIDTKTVRFILRFYQSEFSFFVEREKSGEKDQKLPVLFNGSTILVLANIFIRN